MIFSFHIYQNIEKITEESKKVYRAIEYLRGVVDKSILQMLPGSADVVLETVMEVHQLLGSYIIAQEK